MRRCVWQGIAMLSSVLGAFIDILSPTDTGCGKRIAEYFLANSSLLRIVCKHMRSLRLSEQTSPDAVEAGLNNKEGDIFLVTKKFLHIHGLLDDAYSVVLFYVATQHSS